MPGATTLEKVVTQKSLFTQKNYKIVKIESSELNEIPLQQSGRHLMFLQSCWLEALNISQPEMSFFHICLHNLSKSNKNL